MNDRLVSTLTIQACAIGPGSAFADNSLGHERSPSTVTKAGPYSRSFPPSAKAFQGTIQRRSRSARERAERLCVDAAILEPVRLVRVGAEVTPGAGAGSAIWCRDFRYTRAKAPRTALTLRGAFTRDLSRALRV